MKQMLAVTLIAALTLFADAGAQTPPVTMPSSDADIQAAITTLLSVPTAAGAIASSRRINAEMHYAGTPGDKHLAQWMAAQLRAAGFEATIESFTSLVPQPGHFALTLLSQPAVNFNLHEVPILSDPDGTRPDAGIPYNGWSKSGVVTAPIVYVGRGLDDDYHRLAAAGVAVRGRIALVRYGAQFRGLLAKRAADNGAAAVILYSDPAGNDGSAHGAAYPNGPYRPLGSTQRGSVGRSVPVPVLPVNANVARVLLRAIHGVPAPQSMTGGLNVPYMLGESSVPVRVTVDEPFVSKTLWNTIGVLRGKNPSQEVVFGGHRDAWVYGVTDNGDGISTLIETAKALGALARTGWQPQRSIVIAGWDGEEIGELGSTAYVEAHKADLQSGCVAYVNFDEGESGQLFGAAAAAALAHVPALITAHVPDPRNPSQTVLARWQAQTGGATVDSPSGGSDFEPFIYQAGIPIVDFGFSGPFGVYHSGFDDIHYALTEADPGFVNHRAVAQILALIAFHLSEGPIEVIYRFAPYAGTMRAALAKIATTPDQKTLVAPFAAAVDRYARRAAALDHAENSGAGALDAVHRLDVLCYSANGYAGLPLPAIAAAVANGSPAAITAAVKASTAELDAITAELGT